MHKNIILVHNGIINNFQEIKKFLIKKGFTFYSETDTEVIANLIEYYLLENNTIDQSIKLANLKLNGTWALAIVYTLEPDKIFITRHGSPLILGYNDDLIICMTNNQWSKSPHNEIERGQTQPSFKTTNNQNNP